MLIKDKSLREKEFEHNRKKFIENQEKHTSDIKIFDGEGNLVKIVSRKQAWFLKKLRQNKRKF